MEPMSVLMSVWAVLTTVLVILLIYRSALSMHEDDQLFLDNAESHLEKEQQLLAVRMDKLRPFVAGLSASSGLLALAMAGLWLWGAWSRF
jgi:small-conductance mechanosensitive channel